MAAGEERVYVYALSEPGLPRTFRLLGRALQTLSLGPVDAVVERLANPIEPTADALRAQHDLVSALMRRSRALLPARFGSWLSKDALRTTIAHREPLIVESLDRVRGRCQMTLRVFGAPDETRPREERPSTGTAYLNSRRAAARHLPPEIAIVREAMGGLIVEERIEAGHGELRMTIFHLVSMSAVRAYESRASELTLAPHQVRVSGPWAPFAFSPELF